MKLEANPGRELYSEVDGKKYIRIPIETHFIDIGESLEEIVNKYATPKVEPGDIFCVSCKIVSITTKGLTVKDSDVWISPLARLIVRFVKKWPNDIGYSSPRKMQVAINRAGYPRIFFALVIGTILKLIGKPGYFYRLAGNQINAIDGFTVGFTDKEIFAKNAFLPPRPKQGIEIANRLEKIVNVPVAIIDGNNIENNIISMSGRA